MSAILKGVLGVVEIAAGVLLDTVAPGVGNFLVGLGASTAIAPAPALLTQQASPDERN